MSRWNLAWLIGITLAAVVGVSVTYSTPPVQNPRRQNLKLVGDVLDKVQNSYARELDQDKLRELVEDMINGGLEKLDPHSSFMNADEYRQFRQGSRGNFSGVGIRLGLDPRTGRFQVESPMVGSPAYEAGVLAGDLILKVDGKSLDNWSLKQVVEAIQGAPETEVTLTVLHEGAKKPVDLSMKRAQIHIENIMGDHRDKLDLKKWDFWVDPDSKIAYIRIVAFTETTVEEMTRVVDALQKTGMKGLIVDLRENPGGLLKAAVEVSSLFLPEGKPVVTTKGRNPDEQEVFHSKQNPNLKEGTYYPMVILLNRFSASASEIVAAALQDHARAIIVGERSFGKGSVQNLIDLEGGRTALKLTTASYWRPSGRNIHRFPDAKDADEWGVKPDQGFELKLSDEERAEYYKWRRERDILRRPGEQAKPPDNGKKEFRDKVMDKALEHLRAEIAKNGKKDAQAPRQIPNAPAARMQPQPTSSARDNAFAESAERSYRNIVR